MNSMNINHWFNTRASRKYLQKPMSCNGLTVATNGHIVLFAPLADYDPIPENLSRGMAEILNLLSTEKLKPLPKIKFPKTKSCEDCNGQGKAYISDCDECEGTGEIEYHSGWNNYTWNCQTCDGKGEEILLGGDCDCQSCKGSGKVYGELDFVQIGGQKFSPNYLRLIINEPDVRYAVTDMPVLIFKTGEYSGCIMGMRI